MSYEHHKSFNPKCEELLIVLHHLFSKYIKDRTYAREIGGYQVPFVWITAEDFISELSYQKDTFFRVIGFLSDEGIIIIQKPDFVQNKTTNAYGINYQVLIKYFNLYNYQSQEERFNKLHEGKDSLNTICHFDPMEIVRKIPGFKQKPGRHAGRKCIVTPRGNYKPRKLLEGADIRLWRVFQTANPLRGYLYLKERDAPVDNARSHYRLSLGGSLNASLAYKQGYGSLGELGYNMAISLENLTLGLQQAFKASASKKWIDKKRHRDYIRYVGAAIKREFLKPTVDGIRDFCAWMKEQGLALMDALKFSNLYKYKNRFRKDIVKHDKKRKPTKMILTTPQPTHVLSLEEKTEQIQYDISAKQSESLPQKEARLHILQKLGPNVYSSWFKDLPFSGESDYCFVAPNNFQKDYLRSNYELGRFKYDTHKPTIKQYN